MLQIWVKFFTLGGDKVSSRHVADSFRFPSPLPAIRIYTIYGHISVSRVLASQLLLVEGRVTHM